MNKEFPLPDNRLNGKVKLEQVVVPMKRDVLRVASSDGQTIEIEHSDEKSEIHRLAGLGTLEYEQQRSDAAKRLNLRLPALDGLVADERRQVEGDNKQGHALSLPEPKPWPDPVNGADLLNELSAIIRRYVVMSAYAADTAALWVVHTYLLKGFGISPRLAITSPEKRCGKTTLLDVLARLVMRPLPTSNATTAAIFRVVEMRQPTLLIDEADTFLKENVELRGILNSGHRKGGAVLRTVGEDLEPRSFSTYSACAMASCRRRLPTGRYQSTCGDVAPMSTSKASGSTAQPLSTILHVRWRGGPWITPNTSGARSQPCRRVCTPAQPTTGGPYSLSPMPPVPDGLSAPAARLRPQAPQRATMTNLFASFCWLTSGPCSPSATWIVWRRPTSLRD
jgi:hypothetical protein